jgi:cytochrome c
MKVIKENTKPGKRAHDQGLKKLNCPNVFTDVMKEKSLSVFQCILCRTSKKNPII